MKPLGRNRGAYHGETIDIDEVCRRVLAAGHRGDWKVARLAAAPETGIPVLTRESRDTSTFPRRVYLSAGIHGDEPAGPLALTGLLEADAFPRDISFWVCPCLNPTGFARYTREAANGRDLNRDYRHLATAEVRAHVAWLQRQPMFDLCLCLHEDWEAAGFYIYELNPEQKPSLAARMLAAVAEVCPIDLSPMIDGREAGNGIIRPNLDPASRPEWSESLFLIQNKTRLSYTLEAPSDFALDVRVRALEAAVRAAMEACEPLCSAVPGPDERAAQPPP